MACDTNDSVFLKTIYGGVAILPYLIVEIPYWTRFLKKKMKARRQ